jgi:hypothetical protein
MDSFFRKRKRAGWTSGYEVRTARARETETEKILLIH